MSTSWRSPCKINLLLNVLGKRPDGFHDLETIMQPIPLHDELRLEPAEQGIHLACNHPELTTGSDNLVYRAARAFFTAARRAGGVSIQLTKNIPLAAGLGGGSSNAATTLLGLNALFDEPLEQDDLHRIAADLGSDIPFFLQSQSALATGRGECIRPLPPFPVLQGCGLMLVYPGFGISTPWAYGKLADHPEAQNGRPGRAHALLEALQTADLNTAGSLFYNALEIPALRKYPLLQLIQDHLRAEGASAVLMSGSGATTFALTPDLTSAQRLQESFLAKFGETFWTSVHALNN